jgi:prepilin-type N-terminal cleavage/methylation domain-containing protein/prepilin-type processing-associated H-X9-DG protein
MTPCRPKRAFTLIELLVVIAIISMLISMLTPSLSRARQQAKATVCMASMNELMKGVVSYGSDYGFQLPPRRYEVAQKASGAPKVYHGWAEALYQSLYGDDDYALDQNFPVMRNLEDRFKLWVCKSAEPLANSEGHYRVYELTWRRGSLDAVFHRLPLLTDANPRVTNPDDLERADVSTLRIAGLEGDASIEERHYGGANFAFNDGHVERSVTLRERLAEDWDLDPDTDNTPFADSK